MGTLRLANPLRFFLVNITWGVIILVRHQWSGGRLWLLTAMLWFIAVAIDFSHH